MSPPFGVQEKIESPIDSPQAQGVGQQHGGPPDQLNGIKEEVPWNIEQQQETRITYAYYSYAPISSIGSLGVGGREWGGSSNTEGEWVGHPHEAPPTRDGEEEEEEEGHCNEGEETGIER